MKIKKILVSTGFVILILQIVPLITFTIGRGLNNSNSFMLEDYLAGYIIDAVVIFIILLCYSINWLIKFLNI